MESGALRFADDFGQRKYALLELDEKLLETILAGGVTIKGEASDEACLCTSTHTYLLRLAESSNTHYLLPGALAPDTPLGAIEASILTHYELKPMVPRLVKLRRLLAKRKYEGFDTPGVGEADPEASEARQSAKRLTTSSLRAAVQCSEAQLDEALEAMHAVELQGEWRQLSLTYRHQITEYILNLVDEHSWPRSSVGVRDVLEQSAIEFPDFAPEAVYHCMGTLSEQPLPRGVDLSAIAAGLTLALDERKVSFFHAEKMLHQKKRWTATEFFDRWRADARGSDELDMQMLRGIAVEVELGKDRVKHIQWLPAGALPTGTKERLTSLFNIKPSWKLEEIGAYLDDVLEQEVGYTKEQILIQHARQMKDETGAAVFQQRL